MKNRTILYWSCQLGGWGFFVLGNYIIASMQETPKDRILVIALLIFLMGISTTHLFRAIVHRYQWIKLSLIYVLPIIALSALAMSFIFTTVNTLVLSGFNASGSVFDVSYLKNILNFSALFLLWNIIYFAIKAFENFKREEILNLQLTAANTEIELNSFKAQMNPHFMFNSLNSIRALVDEDPEVAKRGITMLSGILRNNLLLGKKQTVSLADEMDLVEKYLSLEKIRFEERLQLKFDIQSAALRHEVPPFMIQTIAENGIKHGVSKRVEGGVLHISAKMVETDLIVEVKSSGEYTPEPGHEGVGLANTRKRLFLLYKNKASFDISSSDGIVTAVLKIPQTQIEVR